ncbi:MAG: hypothetical protein IPI45_07130 [Saprospiraceae bacterium]|nr:hypothetical protein [Saprospiraceae bacterium]MBK7737534.1 hypothetical protein [Saprospiraceae bacterium]MBK7913882.1 hypothetical protein [Saprospiraceae bacterium]
MDNKINELNTIQFIRELCLDKTEDELLDLEQNFRGFLLVIKEIADRLEVEGKTLEDFDDQLV